MSPPPRSPRWLAIDLAIVLVVVGLSFTWVGVEPRATIVVITILLAARVGTWWWPVLREPSPAPVLEVPTPCANDDPRALLLARAELQHTREQIHRTTIEVASAAAEIEASIGVQVIAAREQIDGVAEVGGAIERLREASARIAEVSSEQVEHAEQARVQAEQVANKTAALQQSIEQVGALLQQISEIASRSDLLALNGSLEATRAGEAGRGFALIATEMRRLAERVGMTADAVRQALAKIAEIHGDSLRATHDSHKFAERTAEDARRVHSLARVQAADAKLVGLSVAEIAEIAERVDAATDESRAAAVALHEQARALERLFWS